MIKHTFFVTVLWLCLAFTLRGQCGMDSLLPVKIGMTKFQVINALNLNKNVFEIESLHDKWRHPNYLKGDSIFMSQVNFRYSVQPCGNGDNNIVILEFSDSYLYKVEIRTWYKPVNFDKCLQDYKQMFQSLKKAFPILDSVGLVNASTKEQMGEGLHMFRSKDEQSKAKFETLNLQYSFSYKIKQTPGKLDYHISGDIDEYLLELTYINLKDTKLDRRGDY